MTAPIADPVNPRLKLLAAGIEVTDSFIAALSRRGIESIILSQLDIAILHAFSPQGRRKDVPAAHRYVRSSKVNDHSRSIDQKVDSTASLSIQQVDAPLAAEIQKPANCAYAPGLQRQWATETNAQIGKVDEFYDDTIHGRGRDIGLLHQTCDDLLDRIAEDQDALMCLASTPYESDYPTRHGVHLAGVAMTIGVEMGLDRGCLIDLGIGCLLHDIGMRAIGLRMFDTTSVLSYSQLRRLADHPVEALQFAGRYGNVSEESMMVAYQVHERLDGSGYPRGRTRDQIHPLAKIASVADAFVGMLARRKHRLAIQGYYVMAQLLDEMKAGKFDARVMRGLLHATSLYPLGSYVTFDNDCVGRVIRSGREQFVQPTVEMWQKDQLDEKPVIINLTREPGIRITGSMPASRAA